MCLPNSRVICITVGRIVQSSKKCIRSCWLSLCRTMFTTVDSLSLSVETLLNKLYILVHVLCRAVEENMFQGTIRFWSTRCKKTIPSLLVVGYLPDSKQKMYPLPPTEQGCIEFLAKTQVAWFAASEWVKNLKFEFLNSKSKFPHNFINSYILTAF